MDADYKGEEDSGYDEYWDPDERSDYTAEQILQVFGAFDDIPKNAKAYRVLALMLQKCGHHKQALVNARRALNTCEVSQLELRSRILNLIANVLLKLKDFGGAATAINEALSISDAVPQKLLRGNLLTRASAELKAGNKRQAITTYEEARVASTEDPLSGFYLHATIDACLELHDDKLAIELMKNWKPMERLSWATWNYENAGFDFHEAFWRAATRAGQRDFIFSMYDEIIKLLENIDAAPPIRYQLAGAHCDVNLDIPAAKAITNELLDLTSSGDVYPFTDEEPAYTVVCAIASTAEMIFEQYRTTADPAVKAQLYAEIGTLTTRPLAQSVTSIKSELGHYYLTMGRMARKMAPAQEFHAYLQKNFDLCYEALVDNVGWNDMLNLNNLGMLVSTLPGLEREAQILVSAQFSKLDPQVKYSESDDEDQEDEGEGEKEEDEDEDEDKPNGVAEKEQSTSDEDEDEEDEEGNDDEEEDDDDDDDDHGGEGTNEDGEDGNKTSDNDLSGDYPLPIDEGDLDDTWNRCAGTCEPRLVWRAWKNRPMYLCTICFNCVLCEACYQKRQEYNRNGGNEACVREVGSLYCGMNHKYIRGPVPGWKGIKDGVMIIKPDDDEKKEEEVIIKFRDWLDDLKNVKWKQAWDRFWLEED
jgi:tetratricopeptide (TPR) repeat protein